MIVYSELLDVWECSYISKNSQFINNSEYEEIFTNLYFEYLDFLKKANFFNSKDIKISK